jgi:cyclic pyranopterin phosphate synthase
MTKLAHLDESEAIAEAFITLSAEVFEGLMGGDGVKSDVFSVARIAGIMAAKKTAELIPLYHPIALNKVGVDFEPLVERHAIRITASAKATGSTGAEMEVLTAASIVALTLYDMVKDRATMIEGLKLVSKPDGNSEKYLATSRGGPVPKPTLGKVSVLMSETGFSRVRDVNAQREAFRAFMTNKHLRATEWAKQADVPAAQIYAYLTGKVRALAPDVVSKLARAARVREEDMFRA